MGIGKQAVSAVSTKRVRTGPGSGAAAFKLLKTNSIQKAATIKDLLRNSNWKFRLA
jgi:hypothetical protein